jgi:hypothetical protein
LRETKVNSMKDAAFWNSQFVLWAIVMIHSNGQKRFFYITSQGPRLFLLLLRCHYSPVRTHASLMDFSQSADQWKTEIPTSGNASRKRWLKCTRSLRVQLGHRAPGITNMVDCCSRLGDYFRLYLIWIIILDLVVLNICGFEPRWGNRFSRFHTRTGRLWGSVKSQYSGYRGVE